jgi:hypothetical protein
MKMMKTSVGLLAMILAVGMMSCSEAPVMEEQEFIAKDQGSLKTVPTDECEEETAWAEGMPYNAGGRGSWATYLVMDTELKDGVEVLVNTCRDVYAGRDGMYVGGVCLDPQGDGTVLVKFTFNPCWSLQDVEEAIKIMGYDVAPSGNPSIGNFDTFKGQIVYVESVFNYIGYIAEYPYYGIHLDVENCCPDPE